MSELFPFDLPDPFKPARWRRARWKATRADIETRGGRIVGLPEVRSGGGGTAGHVQSSPAPSGTMPADLCDGSEPVGLNSGKR